MMMVYSAGSQGHWITRETPAEGFLKAVHFSDSLHGWIAGNAGVIIHTDDGGENWTTQESGTVNDISDIFFLDNEKGWATAFNFSTPPYGTTILKTENGGMEWEQALYPEENIFMNCILFLDPLNGWMGGTPHALVRTTDGGLTWQQASVDSSTLAFFPVISIEFFGENYGYACGGLHDIAGVIWMTSNGGDNWSAIDVFQAPADEIHELHAFDSLRVIGIGGDPDFAFGAATIRTMDGGENWDYQEIGAQGNGFDIDFRTEYEAWSPLGGTGKLVYSLDTGNTWTEITSPENTAIFDIHFPDSLHGWAVGQDGAVLEYIPPFPVGTGDISLSNQGIFNFFNFPDPFVDRTEIFLSVPVSGMLELNVYDGWGRCVKTITEELPFAGRHQFSFERADLRPGIYFCHVEFTSEKGLLTRTEKMVISGP